MYYLAIFCKLITFSKFSLLKFLDLLIDPINEKDIEPTKKVKRLFKSCLNESWLFFHI